MGEIVAVDSVVYNLAGDELNRPNYLQSLIVQNVLSGTKSSMSDSIMNGYLHGPAMQLRRFYNWANNPANYDTVGMPTGALEIRGTLDASAVSSVLPHAPGEAVWAQTAYVDDPDISYWAQQWILANRPDDIDSAWTADYDPDTEELAIVFADSTSQVVAVTDFDPLARYVYVYYTTVTENEAGSTVTGATVTLGVSDSFPDTTGWTLLSTDSGPPIHRTYQRQTSFDDDRGIGTLTETMHQFENGTNRTYRIDTQTTIYRDFSGTKLFIYKVGTGTIPAMDALVADGATYGEFFPFIPFRLNTQFISETYKPDVYAQVKKAFKKATSGNYDKLIDQLKDNEHLGDIDHGYVVFGVSLNVLEPACKRYIYKFFDLIRQGQTGGPTAYADYLAARTVYDAKMAIWTAWKANPIGPEPARPGAVPTLPGNSVRISGTGSINSHYDVRISWKYIDSGSGVGLWKPGAKTGDIWQEITQTDDIYSTSIINGKDGLRISRTLVERVHHLRITWQRSPTSYTYLEVIGPVFKNYVYNSHAVTITAKQALEDPDESGFIIPLHFETWRQTSLTDTSQMSTACVFAVFNCFEVHKTKWYETGIFKILLVIVIAVVSVAFTGGAGLGLLGTNFAVGASLGLTGLTAAIAGAVVNALAALVLTTLLQLVTQNLGIIGQIISFVVMFAVGQISAGFSTGSMAIHWGDLLKVDNLMKLTNAIGNGVGNMLRDQNLELQQEAIDYAQYAKKAADKIQQAFLKEFGYGGALIDPLMFVDSTKAPIAESSDTFLTRTLMTGSDIADMSRELLYNFPEYSLKLPDAFT